MATPLRIIIVEDSEPDTELLLRELRRGGYIPEYERVETAEGLTSALVRQSWDLIISDNAMPNMNSLQALTITQQMGLDIPFIIVSGSIGEDVAVDAMRTGAHDYLMKGNIARLLPAITRELREAHMREERRKAEETIHSLAYIDQVTGLPNRVRLLELIKEAVTVADRDQGSVAVLLMNLDRFREINDALGNVLGDSLLQKVGSRLRNALFAPDVMGRLGSDEFCVLLPQLAGMNDIEVLIKKLQRLLEAPFILEEIPIFVEASFGVAVLPDHADLPDTLLQRAEIAMYRAKKMASGYAIYTPEYDRRSPERIGLMAELREAIDTGQLLLHFQPQLEIQSDHIVGTEALVRWQHPRMGLLPPDKFILAAEQTGLIRPLTRWVLTEALKRSLLMKLHVSVNLSARSLHDPWLPLLVEEIFSETGALAQQLTLEVTESAIVLDPERAEHNLAALNRLGVRISIDDFGTGYTSLASIKNLAVNEIKIDKSFVLGMLESNSDATIVRSVIELGHNLGMQVVAEGVETGELYDAIKALGCDYAQGYFISKPQPSEFLQHWMTTSPWKLGRYS